MAQVALAQRQQSEEPFLYLFEPYLDSGQNFLSSKSCSEFMLEFKSVIFWPQQWPDVVEREMCVLKQACMTQVCSAEGVTGTPSLWEAIQRGL